MSGLVKYSLGELVSDYESSQYSNPTELYIKASDVARVFKPFLQMVLDGRIDEEELILAEARRLLAAISGEQK